MDKRTEQFFVAAKQVHLSAQEKHVVYSDIMQNMATPFDSFTADNSVLTPAEKQMAKLEILEFIQGYKPRSWWSVLHSLVTHKLIAVIAVVAVFVSASAGTAYSAESSIPGDVLYPIKLHVNEPARGFFAFDKQQKAEFRMFTFERRMNEMHLLARKPFAPTETVEEALARMEEHGKRLQMHLNELESLESVDTMREHLEQKLAEHQQFYSKVQSGSISVDQLEKIHASFSKHKDRFRKPEKKLMLPPIPHGVLYERRDANALESKHLPTTTVTSGSQLLRPLVPHSSGKVLPMPLRRMPPPRQP